MNDKNKLIEAAFKAAKALDELKNDMDIATGDRDVALRALKEAAGIGPFEDPKTKAKYQIVQRGQSFYFREAK